MFYHDEEESLEPPERPRKPRRKYISALKNLKEQYQPEAEWLLQEDGDPSHGKRKIGLATQLKEREGIKSLYYPA
ncbi:hypothetical protein M7I_8350 [Glarea lozoyensis 74030]|uniref:Uncharacterized protein n=1 Tax=Glarea lozoyensis (strain ATCC 74030 / MF5533) TaxID=1104152 RepID=H0EZS1_GLAL7|nr:hypothetical protein M7I_8350 [Glarea lozoyensis 74030]